MSMNEFLAQVYKTAGAPTDEDLQKVAEAELFAKLAYENGFNLDAMTDEQVADLWNKVGADEEAGEMPPQFAKKEEGGGDEKKDEKKEEKDEKKEEKEVAAVKEAAAQEFAMQKAAQDQLAFMDYCGRVMAHSYVDELTKIGAAMETAETVDGTKVAETGVVAATAAAPDDVDDRIRKLAAAAPGIAPQLSSVSSTEKLDWLAADNAVAMAKEAQMDTDEVINKLNAILTLGPKETTKLAAAENIDQAIHIRGLELLEQAGYEVNWE